MASGGTGHGSQVARSLSARQLSPLRNSTAATDVPALVAEQLAHFGIEAASPFGESLARFAARLYEAQADLEQLWRVTQESISGLDRSDRIAWFNAKKFLSFQLAKLLDTLQNPIAAHLPKPGLQPDDASRPKDRMPFSTTLRPSSRPTRSSPARRRISMPAPNGSKTPFRAKSCCWRFTRGC